MPQTTTIAGVSYFVVDTPLLLGNLPADSVTQAIVNDPYAYQPFAVQRNVAVQRSAAQLNSQAAFRFSKAERRRLGIKPNHYTDTNRRADQFWRVRLQYSLMPDRSVDLWFEQEAEAREASRPGVFTLGQVLDAVNPLNAQFAVLETAREKKDAEPNRYTGRQDQRAPWRSLLWCEQYDRYAELWFGDDQGSAAKFAEGMHFTLPDLLIPFFTPPAVDQRTIRTVQQITAPADRQVGSVPDGFTGPLGVFKIVVLGYVASNYVAFDQLTGGFVDVNGFHGPGSYPAGAYPAGYQFGEFIEHFADGTDHDFQVGTTTPNPAVASYQFVTVQAARILSAQTGFSDWHIIYIPVQGP